MYKQNSNIELPDALPRETQINYFQSLEKGDISVRKMLIEHNLRLVASVLKTRFGGYDDDLFQIGTIGLIKSVDKFDLSKGSEFSTFATTSIFNEIVHYRKVNSKYPAISLDSSTGATHESGKDNDLKLIDTLPDDVDIVADYEDEDIKNILANMLEELPEKKIEAVKHYYGFYDGIPKTKRKTAEIIGKTDVTVWKYIKEMEGLIEKRLQRLELMNEYDLYIKQRYEQKANEVVPKEKNTVYTMHKHRTRAEVDDMLTRLNDDEKELVNLLWGDDLDNPKRSEKWTSEHQKRLPALYSQMYYLLENPDKISQPLYKFLSRRKIS